MRTIVAVLIGISMQASIANAESIEPRAQVEALIAQLRTDKLDGFLEKAFAGSLVAKQKPMQIDAMSGQAKAALQFYGKLTDYELLETEDLGKSLRRIKWMTKHKDDMPLFWNAIYYRRHGKWEPLTLIFFDNPIQAGI